MFERKNKIARDGIWLHMDENTYNYLTDLENSLSDVSLNFDQLRIKAINLEKELNKLKNEREIVENMELKPVISNVCCNCDFCVLSPYTGYILGCGKDAVCEDFKNRERQDR